MKQTLFKNRSDAGKFLAAQLRHHAGKPDVIVLALPRGGVPVGFEIAAALDVPLDVFLVRKLGVPGYEELAMGAIATGGVKVLNEEVIQHLSISEKAIEAVAVDELMELHRRQELYLGGRKPTVLAGRHAILVDDGLATGSSMRAAVRALRQLKPASITVAVPVAAKDTCDSFRGEVDEVLCGKTPEPFVAVGNWYEDFTQTTDDEVSELLNHAAHLRKVGRVQSGRKSDAAQKIENMKPDENVVCDVCGRFGAYEMGDQHLCSDCYQSRQSCCPEFGDFDLWKADEEAKAAKQSSNSGKPGAR